MSAVPVVVVYDISENRRRRRAARALATEGQRLQWSVFLLPSRSARAALDPLVREIDPRRERLHAFPLCRRCAAAMEMRGKLLDAGGIDQVV